jgi:hypothetical protein
MLVFAVAAADTALAGSGAHESFTKDSCTRVASFPITNGH